MTGTETSLYEVTSQTSTVDLSSLEVLNWAPVWLTGSERLLLYSLIYSLRPKRYLEIGTLHGGSALIVAAAMDASNSPGRIVCVDIAPQIDPSHWRKLEHRVHMVIGHSSEVIPSAYHAAGGPFDFVFVDGDHRASGVLSDANKVLPFVAMGGYLLFHDSYHEGVIRATRDFSLQHLGRVLDFGNITREFSCDRQPGKEPEYFCGFRLMQLRPPVGGLLSRTWHHWRLGLVFAVRQRTPVPRFVKSAWHALRKL
jgi:predicted O-methyltransferase YrrM